MAAGIYLYLLLVGVFFAAGNLAIRGFSHMFGGHGGDAPSGEQGDGHIGADDTGALESHAGADVDTGADMGADADAGVDVGAGAHTGADGVDAGADAGSDGASAGFDGGGYDNAGDIGGGSGGGLDAGGSGGGSGASSAGGDDAVWAHGDIAHGPAHPSQSTQPQPAHGFGRDPAQDTSQTQPQTPEYVPARVSDQTAPDGIPHAQATPHVNPPGVLTVLSNWLPIRPMALICFATVTGGIGSICMRLGWTSPPAHILAIASGYAVAMLLGVALPRMLWRAQNTSAAERYELIGLSARVTSAIAEGGFGRIAYTARDNAYGAPARHIEGRRVKQGALVVICEIRGNVFYVSEVVIDDTNQ